MTAFKAAMGALPRLSDHPARSLQLRFKPVPLTARARSGGPARPPKGRLAGFRSSTCCRQTHKKTASASECSPNSNPSRRQQRRERRQRRDSGMEPGQCLQPVHTLEDRYIESSTTSGQLRRRLGYASVQGAPSGSPDASLRSAARGRCCRPGGLLLCCQLPLLLAAERVMCRTVG